MKHKRTLERFFSFFDKYPREYFIFGFFVFFALANAWTTLSYTVFDYDFYKNLAEKQQLGVVSNPSSRGTIFSSTNSGTVFSTSVNLYDIAIDPQMEWDKEKLALFLEDIVYKQNCYLQNEKTCYDNMLKFLKVLEIPDFTTDKDYLNTLIREELQKRLSKTKVTSVLLATELDNEKMDFISSLSLPWLYPYEKSLYVNPEEIRDEENFAEVLSTPLEIEKETLKNLIKKRELRYISIISKLSISLSDEIKSYLEEEADAIKKWILDKKNSIGDFIILEDHPARFYPEKQVWSQIIGFVDSEGFWHYGLEGYYDEVLRWENTKKFVKKDTMGRTIDPIDFGTEESSLKWADVYTTIDRNIQSKVEQILESWVKEYRANKGTIVVMEPNSGEILAMANYPSFDPNNAGDVYELEKVNYGKYPNPETDLLGKIVLVEDKERGEEFFYEGKKIYLRLAEREELWDYALVKYKYKNDFWAWVYKNDAISSLYEPWSIMKAITVSIGIDSGEIKRYDMYNDTGKLQIDNFTISNVSEECLWYNSFNHALNFSCNVWMIRISQRIGESLFSQYLSDFWFWKLTNISLEWEVNAQIQPYQKWSKAQLFTTSYGLGISVTPIQMAAAYSVIANSWYYVKPRIIDSIRFPSGKVIQYKKEVLSRVIKESTSETVTDMLVNGVEVWFAKTGAVPGYTLAWKTWTSQISYKWWYETGVASTTASYAWFWPAEDPKFVIIVKLERPRVSVYWGATASALFSQTAKYLFDYYSIPSKGS